MNLSPVVSAVPSFGLLVALNASGKHIYGGTVPPAEVERRRARNKAARIARRAARR